MSRSHVMTKGDSPTTSTPESVTAAIERHAALRPDHPALVFRGSAMTYGELNARANRLAMQLHTQGVGPEVPVGVFCPRGFESTVALLGCFKSGAIYVPLDPALPDDRLQRMFATAGIGLVVVTEETLARRPNPHGPAAILRRHPVEPLPDPVFQLRPSNHAYLLFDSRSTGKPHGIATPHAALENLIRWQQQALPTDPSTRALQLAPIGSAVFLQETCSTLAGGGTLIVAEADAAQDASRVDTLVRENRVGRIFLPTARLHEIAQAFAANPSAGAMEGLRDVICVGDPLRVTPAIRHFFRTHDGCRLHLHYGFTEAQVIAAHTLAGSCETWPDRPCAGNAIRGTTIGIRDDNGSWAGTGQAGEICVSGPMVARGYFREPVLTRARFLADPFRPDPGATWLYRTGDRGLLREDGTLEVLEGLHGPSTTRQPFGAPLAANVPVGRVA